MKRALFIFFLYSTFISAQRNTVIFWDASWSMSQRGLHQEMQYLNQYYAKHLNSKTTLVVFNYNLVEEKEFLIVNGNWEKLKSVIQHIKYDGATSFSSLSNYTGFDDALMFTDGYQNIHFSKPINVAKAFYIISSKTNINSDNLQLLAELNSGEFIDLKLADKKASQVTVTQSLIKKNDSDLSLGKHTQLNEVFVNATVDASQKKVAKTGYDDKQKKKLGYAVQSYSSEDIDPIHTNATTAIEGKFSGVKIDGGSDVGAQQKDLSRFTVRGGMSSILSNKYGLIVLDGVPLRRSNSYTQETLSTDFINPDNIADVTVLKGLAATNRYGSMGSNGVLLITTKTASHSQSNKNTALATNNNYSGKVKLKKNQELTPYLKELKANKSVAQAYGIYLNQRDTYKNDSNYFFDVYHFFNATNPKLSIQILSNILEKEQTDLPELKAMLYHLYRTSDDVTMIYEVSKRILELYPNRLEAYIDLANAYEKIGDYQKALSTLENSYNELKNKPSLQSLKKLVRDEIKNLVYRHGSSLEVPNLEKSLNYNIAYDARLTFDWNEENAEFEVQFVNPQNKFFSWKHTNTEDPIAIQNEIDHGYNKNQFEINGNGSGKWLINVKYLGNKSPNKRTNLIIKCRVQKNFGKSNQKETIHIMRHFETGVNQQFFTLDI